MPDNETNITSNITSNQASVVGRGIQFLDEKTGRPKGMQGLIIAYDPRNNSHTVEFEDGSEKVAILNKHRFRWLVSTCEAADKSTWKDRTKLAAQVGAIGRKLKVCNMGGKYINGEIIDFDEETKKHEIKFNRKAKSFTKKLNLEKLKWRFTDLIGRYHPGSNSIVSSRYAGVRRGSERSWHAYKGAIGKGYIGTFSSEKDAALAHDFYARLAGNDDINFKNEQIDESEVLKRKTSSTSTSPKTIGKSKFRGVHWQINRKRWMARYTLSHKGEKNVNLGAFDDARHAALAFDAEARKRGRPDKDLNFPDEHPTDAQIELWKTNTTHYTMSVAGRKKSSQYRGVTRQKGPTPWHAQCHIKKVIVGSGRCSFGCYKYEKQAALVFDRICRKYGVPEKELNFPRNASLREVRLFDDECYFCNRQNPTDPVSTPCNHVFCRECIVASLESSDKCPCCQTPNLTQSSLNPVTLIPWHDSTKPVEGEGDNEGNQIDESGEDAGTNDPEEAAQQPIIEPISVQDVAAIPPPDAGVVAPDTNPSFSDIVEATKRRAANPPKEGGWYWHLYPDGSPVYSSKSRAARRKTEKRKRVAKGKSKKCRKARHVAHPADGDIEEVVEDEWDQVDFLDNKNTGVGATTVEAKEANRKPLDKLAKHRKQKLKEGETRTAKRKIAPDATIVEAKAAKREKLEKLAKRRREQRLKEEEARSAKRNVASDERKTSDSSRESIEGYESESKDCINASPEQNPLVADLKIGSGVSVWWPDQEEYFDGVVTKIVGQGSNPHYVEYDDGDYEWTNLNNRKFTIKERNPHAHDVFVGSRVSVYWPVEKEYFEGTVTKVSIDMARPHYVKYDDGDEERTNLYYRKFNLL